MHLAILGMNHRHQIVGQVDGDSRALRLYLENELRPGGYDAVAEELNEAAIDLWGGSESTARMVAGSLGLRHCFCDPDAGERATLGIPSTEQLKKQFRLGKVMGSTATKRLDAAEKSYWPIREAFWLARLQALGAAHILFILGSEHVHSFGALLTQKGIGFTCLNKSWQP